MDKPNEANAFEIFDINKRPNIQTVSDAGEDIDADSPPAASPVAVPRPQRSCPNSSSPLETSQARRRTRGVSILSVRQSHEPVRETQLHTPSPLRAAGSPRGSQPGSSSHSPTHNAINRDGGPYTSANSSSSGTPAVASAVSSSGNKSSSLIDRIPDSDKLLSTYMSQLAVKEARVGDLRVALATLQRELSEAETDLNNFRDNGQKLADLVHKEESRDLPESAPMGGQVSRRRASNSDSQKDVLGIGKRVVDEIGIQFWSFLEDVKSATFGNVDFEDSRDQHYHRSPHLAGIPNLPPKSSSPSDPPSPKLPPRPRSPGLERPSSSSPQRRQLSPKRSIQNFMRNRSPSPVRNSFSPTRSAKRQEIAEHHATQRLRESERLTRKLSSLDLKAKSAQYPSSESLLSHQT